jgi:glycine/serine hydroxymethyltransferase
MKEPEMQKIGTWIADILSDITNTAKQTAIRAEIEAVTAKFLVP